MEPSFILHKKVYVSFVSKGGTKNEGTKTLVGRTLVVTKIQSDRGEP